MSSSAIEPEAITHVGRHILKLFARVGELERRLAALERRRRRGASRKVSGRRAAEDSLDARDKARERRRLERAEEQARLTTVEPESLGRGVGLQRFLRGDDWL